MNRMVKNSAPPRASLAAALLMVLCASGAGSSFAALTDIAQVPLSVSSTTVVKPNVMFVLDDSGSMAWTHAPDDALNFLGNYGYTSFQCNSIYYNPAISYDVPKKANGTDYPASSFTAAWYNGFDTTQGTIDLSSKFFSYDNVTSFGNGQESNTQAYYYTYSGTNTIMQGTPPKPVPNVDFSNTNSSSYKECNSTIGNGPGSSVFTKVKVTSTSGPSTAPDERQNFANWFSYYRTRILMMKSGAGRAFNAVSDKYRVGFSTINYTGTDTNNSEFLNISDFNLAQRTSWYSKVYAITPGNSTPLRIALAKIGRIYGGKLGTDPVQYSCQQNFTILTTDGYWNEASTPKQLDGTTDIGNQDGNAGSMPPPLYEGDSPRTVSNSLADVAAYYYNTDLRPGNPGDPGCTINGNDVCKDNVAKSGVSLTKDDAAWQHMTTFTLGLGVNGTLKYDPNYLLGQSTDFNAILGSTSKGWPKPVSNLSTTVDDLWHAAVNGRGQYFSARDPDKLVEGLTTALSGINSREAAGAAAATSNLEPVANDNFAFIANYRTVKWDGDVEARTIDINTGILSATNTWSAQTLLDARITTTSDNRKIFTINANGVGARDFFPGNFTLAEKTAWFKPTTAPALTQSSGWNVLEAAAATPDSIINYLRGQGQYEMEVSNTSLIQIYRGREHALGDIIDGKPVFVRIPPFNYSENSYGNFKANLTSLPRQGVVYVAANDGMLHAFNSDDGSEMWAYIPSFVLPNLKSLADANYATNHQFSVDGSPTISDIWDGSQWRTILVAGLNAGGKGYYALDVTTPATPTILWEFKDANLGYSFGNPVIGKQLDQTWIVAFSSGYNNVGDGVGRLYVLNAFTGAQMPYSPISTGVGTAASPSGLGKISAWTDTGLTDNTIQRIYGGDMFGNLWRFDINGSYPPAGKDAFLLATLQSGSYLQPITTKPELGLVGTKPVIFVGTGRYIGSSDVTDTGQQSLYAIKDNLTGIPVGNPRTSTCGATPSQPFVKQTLAVLDVNTRVITSTTAVDFTNTHCGWYVDFNPGNSTPGECINVDMKLQLGVLGVITNIPETSVCTVGGSSFIYFFDYSDGTSVSDKSFVEVTDINGVVSTVAANKVGERIGNATAVGMNTYRLKDGRVVTTVTTSDDKHPVYGNPTYTGAAIATRRVLWRELLN